MKIFYFLVFLTLTQNSFGQTQRDVALKEKARIDSIIENINLNKNNHSEGIIEGPFTTSNNSETGGWEAYYLYKNKTAPLRIRYNEALEDTYKEFEFFYNDRELIFASLNIRFYEEKKKSINKNFYFKNSQLIFESSIKSKKYSSEYMQQTGKFVLNIIQE